jgi:predicted homoserine dehydrogenase-like protein
LPIGLAHRVKVNRDVGKGAILTASDVALDAAADAVRIRREMERQARQARTAVAAE